MDRKYIKVMSFFGKIKFHFPSCRGPVGCVAFLDIQLGACAKEQRS
jgi:hypothetical protein